MAEAFAEDVGLLQSEMRAVLATMTGIPADQIGGWAVVVRQSCGRPGCIGYQGCEDGPLCLLSAATVEAGDGGHHGGEPYILHMLAGAIEDIAVMMRDRT